jgi:microcystin-dependent protein
MAVNGKSRRSYRGAPVSNTLGATLNAAATGITLAVAVSGWSTDAEPFFVVVDPGTAKEEKICVKYASATTLTVVDPASTSTWSASANGRGADNTTDRQHEQGAVIYPVFTAVEANQANELVSKYANAGSVVYQGSGTPGTFTELAIGTASHVLRVNSGLPQWGQVTADGIATGAVTSAKILDGTIVADDIADGAITSAKILDGTIALGDLATALQRFLVPVGTIAMYGGAAAPTGWLLCDGTATTGYTALAAIVGATTPDFKGRFPVGDNATLTLLGTGGSLTIGANNLPAHSHPNTATATVTITDPGHSHTIDTFDPVTGGSQIGAPDPAYGANTGDEANVVNTATTGITATSAVTMTNANNVTTASDYYQPYLVVNYIIKHD